MKDLIMIVLTTYFVMSLLSASILAARFWRTQCLTVPS